MEILVNLLLIYLCFSMFIKACKRYKKATFFINLFVLSIVVGTMYEIPGSEGDYDNYRAIFNAIREFELPEKEAAFYAMNFALKQLSEQYYVAFYIFILIINFLVLKIIYKYSYNIELSLIVYIIAAGYFSPANILRQAISIAIYFYSVRYLIEKKYIIYILICFVAFQFHVTSMLPAVITPLVVIFNEKLSKYYILYFIAINSLIVVEPAIRNIGLQVMGNGYDGGTFFYGSSILHYIVQLAFVAIYWLSIKKVSDNNTKIFINLATISSTFTLMSNSMVLYARIASFFNIFHSIALANIVIVYKNNKERRVVYYLMTVGLAIYYFLLTTKSFNMENYIMDYFSRILT